MGSDQILEFIYSLFDRNIRLWIQGDTLKVFVPSNTSLTETEKNYIKLNKIQLIATLVASGFDSKDCGFAILSSKSIIQLLSYSQERLWFIDRYEGGSNVYNVPLFYKIAKIVDLAILEQSLRDLVCRLQL